MSDTPDSEPILLPEAVSHYDKIEESARLTRVDNHIELLRTRELLLRFLPASPAVVLDVGGAAGIHAFWLAEKGYTVHLIDAVAHHIDQAIANPGSSSLASATMGDSCDLMHKAGTAHAVLLFGPLYHLIKREDRIESLKEAYRVLRPGGVVLAVGIPRFISLVNCLTEGSIESSQFKAILAGDLQDGQHRNSTGDPSFFTTTFFHHPDELKEEVKEAGFQLADFLAIEGPARLLRDFPTHWQDSDKREWLLEIVRKVEREESLFGVSTHLMAVGRKEDGGA